jgi:hypothetical protein
MRALATSGGPVSTGVVSIAVMVSVGASELVSALPVSTINEVSGSPPVSMGRPSSSVVELSVPVVPVSVSVTGVSASLEHATSRVNASGMDQRMSMMLAAAGESRNPR